MNYFSSLYQMSCPSSHFLIISDRTWVPLLPQTQIPLWAAETQRTSPLLMSGSGRWWRWRTKRVRFKVLSCFKCKHTYVCETNVWVLHSLIISDVFSTAQSVHTANNGASHVGKKVQKNFNNYASVECGAKILGANQEAKVLHIWKSIHEAEELAGWWYIYK